MAVHKPAYVFVIVVTFLILLVAITFSFLASYETPLNKILPGLFIGGSLDGGDDGLQIEKDVDPEPWTFFIWMFIYSYQIIWMVYGLSTLCRKSNDWQGYLYYHPRYMPISLYVVYSMNLLLGIAWVFVWDRRLITPASPILFLMAITLYICIGISYSALNKQGPALMQKGHTREIRLVRGLVHNGLAIYTAWTTIASYVNLAAVLVEVVGFKQEDVSTGILGAYGVILIGIFVLDITVLDKWSRYTITHYMVFVVALTGILDGNESMNRNFIITAVLVGLAAFALLFKIGFVIAKSRQEPEPILRDMVV